jgi:hypothetical protein
MQAALLLTLIGLLFAAPAASDTTVILRASTLSSTAFPVHLRLPDGTPLDRRDLRRFAIGIDPNDVIVFDVGVTRFTRRVSISLTQILRDRGDSLARLSIFDLETRVFHQPSQNELLGVALDFRPIIAVAHRAAFLSGPLASSELDSDLDGLSDLAETGTGVFVSAEDTGTSPILHDSDGDAINDADEVFVHGTNPNLSDEDGDDLDDGEELFQYGTNPHVADTDGDMLDDGAEIFVHNTDPLLADTDEGGRSDGLEVNLDGTDPLDPSDDLVPTAVPTAGLWGSLLLCGMLAWTGRMRIS